MSTKLKSPADEILGEMSQVFDQPYEWAKQWKQKNNGKVIGVTGMNFPEELLRAAVEATYEPRDEVTLDGLVEVVRGAEEAFFQNGAATAEVGLFHMDGGLFDDREPNPAVYLEKMSAAGRREYARTVGRIAADFARVRDGVGLREKAELTARCLRTVQVEAEGMEQGGE